MRRFWLMVGLLASVGGAAGFQEFSFGNVGGWKPLHSWCDTPARVLAATTPAQDDPLSTQPTTLAQWTGSTLSALPYQLGPSDAGAGQQYTVLTPAGQAVSSTPKYFIHTSNIENVQDPAYRMTHVNGYQVPAGKFTCRYVPQAAVLAATAKHSIVVWEHAGQITYASRNRNGTPGAFLTGGTHTLSAGGQDQYTWKQGAYTYVLLVGKPGHVGGSMTVSRAGQAVNQYPLLAYSISVPR